MAFWFDRWVQFIFSSAATYENLNNETATSIYQTWEKVLKFIAFNGSKIKEPTIIKWISQ